MAEFDPRMRHEPPHELPAAAPEPEDVSRLQRLYRRVGAAVLTGAIAFSSLTGGTSRGEEDAPARYSTAVELVSYEAAEPVEPAPRLDLSAPELQPPAPPEAVPVPALEPVPAPPAAAAEAPPRVKPNTEATGDTVYYNQLDDTWRREKYRVGNDDGTIGDNGCGPTTLAMVISTLTDRVVTPVDMARINMDRGYLTSTGSTYHSALREVPKDFGLETRDVRETVEDIRAITDEGGLVIVNGTDRNPNTPATKGGHIFIIRDVTADGRLLVADPASRRKNDVHWVAEDIFGPASVAIAVLQPRKEQPQPPALVVEEAPDKDTADESRETSALQLDAPEFAVLPAALPAPAPEGPVAPAEPQPEVPRLTLENAPELSAPQTRLPDVPALAALDMRNIPELGIVPPPPAPAAPAAPEAAPLPAPASPFPHFNTQDVPPELVEWYIQAAIEYNLDPAQLSAQGQQETGWAEDVISGRRNSRAGAKGVAQFMDGTWKSYAVDANGNGKASPLEPADAIMAQGRFMRDLINRAESDTIPGDPVAHALAAYNAGYGRVRQFNGVPPKSFARGETFDYVNKIIHLWREHYTKK